MGHPTVDEYIALSRKRKQPSVKLLPVLLEEQSVIRGYAPGDVRGLLIHIGDLTAEMDMAIVAAKDEIGAATYRSSPDPDPIAALKHCHQAQTQVRVIKARLREVEKELLKQVRRPFEQAA
jgi:hypothetical protein